VVLGEPPRNGSPQAEGRDKGAGRPFRSAPHMYGRAVVLPVYALRPQEGDEGDQAAAAAIWTMWRIQSMPLVSATPPGGNTTGRYDKTRIARGPALHTPWPNSSERDGVLSVDTTGVDLGEQFLGSRRAHVSAHGLGAMSRARLLAVMRCYRRARREPRRGAAGSAQRRRPSLPPASVA
jgi:hypothetical protein